MFCFVLVLRLILWILKTFGVAWLLCGITRRWIDVCFQPWCNPLWLTGLKAPTNRLTNSEGAHGWKCAEGNRMTRNRNSWTRGRKRGNVRLPTLSAVYLTEDALYTLTHPPFPVTPSLAPSQPAAMSRPLSGPPCTESAVTRHPPSLSPVSHRKTCPVSWTSISLWS